jgi:hypothetical protein
MKPEISWPLCPPERNDIRNPSIEMRALLHAGPQMLMHRDVGTHVRLILGDAHYHSFLQFKFYVYLSGKHALRLKDPSYAVKCNANTATSDRCNPDSDSLSQTRRLPPSRTYCATLRLKEQ